MNPTPHAESSNDTQLLSWEAIHDQIQKHDDELKERLSRDGKGKIEAGTYERSKRRLRSSLYETYITQQLQEIDSNTLSIVSYPDLLDKGAHDEVFRTLLIKRVLQIVHSGTLSVLKKTELILKNVQSIYEAAEKVSPTDGGVTPGWSERKQREIRGNLAREILSLPENIPLVTEYIEKADEFTAAHPGDEWLDGNRKLASHFTYILQAEKRGSQTENITEAASKEESVDVPSHEVPVTQHKVIEETLERDPFHESILPRKEELSDTTPVLPVQSTSSNQDEVLSSNSDESRNESKALEDTPASETTAATDTAPEPSEEKPEKQSLFKKLFGLK